MYANQLKVLLKLDLVSATNLGGIFSCDSVLKIEKQSVTEKYFIIVNIAHSKHEGLHWVLFFKSSDNSNAIFFDSLGQHPKAYGNCVEKALKHFSTFTSYPDKYNLSEKRLQSDSTSVCGIYCLYFAHELCRNKTINMILNRFSTNTLKNDKQVCAWFKKYFKSKVPKYIKTNQYCTSLKKWKP